MKMCRSGKHVRAESFTLKTTVNGKVYLRCRACLNERNREYKRRQRGRW